MKLFIITVLALVISLCQASPAPFPKPGPSPDALALAMPDALALPQFGNSNSCNDQGQRRQKDSALACAKQVFEADSKLRLNSYSAFVASECKLVSDINNCIDRHMNCFETAPIKAGLRRDVFIGERQPVIRREFADHGASNFSYDNDCGGRRSSSNNIFA